MDEDSKPIPPVAGIIYGEIVYWGTVLGSIVSIVGATLAVIVQANVIEPSYVFSAIWEGKDTAAIWEGSVGQLPKGHWYLSQLFTGDGSAMFGLALGVFSVIPALFASAIPLLKKKDYLFGSLAVLSGVISVAAFLGLISLPE